MRTNWRKIRVAAAVVPAAFAIAAVAPAGAQATTTQVSVAAPMSAGDGTPAGAVAWMKAHVGSSGWEHYCEKAVENAYGTTGIWASAIAHWNGASPKHAGDRNPPAGAFVYWNISAYGHVGISDGAGGFYSTSISGAIGHSTTLSHFSSYLGWTPAARPRQ